MRCYDVTFTTEERNGLVGWQTVERVFTCSARSASAARAEFARHLQDAWNCSFKQALQTVRSVRLNHVPSSEGYDVLERQYGKRFNVGDRVQIAPGEGSASGMVGTVAYPGGPTVHVHVALDGRPDSRPAIFHPMSVNQMSDNCEGSK